MRAAMTGRRGPVFVEIPRNVLNDQTLAGEALPPAGYRVTHPLPPHPDAIAEAARLLRQAERPLLLVGGGVTRADASALVVSMAEQHAIPMITAYGRNDAVPNAHPLYIGPLGRAGSAEAAAACRRAGLRLRSAAFQPAPHLSHSARSRRARLRLPGGPGSQARPPRRARAGHSRRWRLPHECPGDRDGRPAWDQRHHPGDEQQLLGFGEGVPEAFLRFALHRLRPRQPAL